MTDFEREVIRTSRQYFNHGSAANLNHWKAAIKAFIRSNNSNRRDK